MNIRIEQSHPADILFGDKKLNRRQQEILDKLSEYGDQILVKKGYVTMLDLSAMTAKTGDEFALFTRKGERLIIRGDAKQVPLYAEDIKRLRDGGYCWSGHTHPGFTDADLIDSDGDRKTLALFGQKRSVIYNAAGRYRVIEQEA